jgi:indole-3-glycerol phosphate synthase
MHSEDQLDKMCEWVSVVGVNNRNLKDFSVDFERSKRLFDQLPPDKPKIAESGLGNAQTLHELFLHGFQGFLIGETFMKRENPGAACADMISEFKRLKES